MLQDHSFDIIILFMQCSCFEFYVILLFFFFGRAVEAFLICFDIEKQG